MVLVALVLLIGMGASTILAAFVIATLIRMYKYDKYSTNIVPPNWTKNFWLAILIQVIIFLGVTLTIALFSSQIFPIVDTSNMTAGDFMYGLGVISNLLIWGIIIVLFLFVGTTLAIFSLNISLMVLINKCLKFKCKIPTLYKVLFTIVAVILLLVVVYNYVSLFISIIAII